MIMSLEDLRTWGYIVDIPNGPGGEKPSEEGGVAKCERCTQPFMVKRAEEAEECLYHWGKPYNRTVNGGSDILYIKLSHFYDGNRGQNTNIQLLFKNDL
jgi:RNA exonuclease 1